jgi:hypothetical protein
MIASMTIANLIAVNGGILLLAVVVRGFWNADKIKPKEKQPRWPYRDYSEGGPNDKRP